MEKARDLVSTVESTVTTEVAAAVQLENIQSARSPFCDVVSLTAKQLVTAFFALPSQRVT